MMFLNQNGLAVESMVRTTGARRKAQSIFLANFSSAETFYWELEANTDDWQLEDGSGNWLLEAAP